jgi:hypothetical protein
MRTLLAAVILSFTLVLPVAAARDDSPYFVDKGEFKKQYKVIALAPVDADALFRLPDSVAQMIEEEVTRRLEKRGYEVLPSSILAGIRKTMEQQVGGIADPATGVVDTDKLRAVREHAMRELWFRNRPDAVATLRISVSTAEFAKGTAEWDGVKQKVASEGRDKGYGGDIAASSVSVAIFDEANRIKYLHYGGLELLQKRVEAMLEAIPADEYFADEKRVRNAAKVAVSEI